MLNFLKRSIIFRVCVYVCVYMIVCSFCLSYNIFALTRGWHLLFCPGERKETSFSSTEAVFGSSWYLEQREPKVYLTSLKLTRLSYVYLEAEDLGSLSKVLVQV